LLASPLRADPPSAAIFVTPNCEGATMNSATLGGDIFSDGDDTLTARGVVFSLTSVNADPQIGGTGVIKVVARGAATGVLTGDINPDGIAAI
jgi:hypothetical protein